MPQLSHSILLRDCSKHPLVDREEQVWDSRTANGRLSENVSEPKVGEITDEFASGMGESQRVTPEEPLKGDDSSRHDGQPY